MILSSKDSVFQNSRAFRQAIGQHKREIAVPCNNNNNKITITTITIKNAASQDHHHHAGMCAAASHAATRWHKNCGRRERRKSQSNTQAYLDERAHELAPLVPICGAPSPRSTPLRTDARTGADVCNRCMQRPHFATTLARVSLRAGNAEGRADHTVWREDGVLVRKKRVL